MELPGFFAFSGAALALRVLAAVFLALMVYTLFFALPFSATYLEAPPEGLHRQHAGHLPG